MRAVVDASSEVLFLGDEVLKDLKAKTWIWRYCSGRVDSDLKFPKGFQNKMRLQVFRRHWADRSSLYSWNRSAGQPRGHETVWT